MARLRTQARRADRRLANERERSEVFGIRGHSSPLATSPVDHRQGHTSPLETNQADSEQDHSPRLPTKQVNNIQGHSSPPAASPTHSKQVDSSPLLYKSPVCHSSSSPEYSNTEPMHRRSKRHHTRGDDDNPEPAIPNKKKKPMIVRNPRHLSNDLLSREDAWQSIEGEEIEEDQTSLPELAEDEDIVERILDQRVHTDKRGKSFMLYEVKWLGDDETTWEPYENFRDTALIDEWVMLASMDYED